MILDDKGALKEAIKDLRKPNEKPNGGTVIRTEGGKSGYKYIFSKLISKTIYA